MATHPSWGSTEPVGPAEPVLDAYHAYSNQDIVDLIAHHTQEVSTLKRKLRTLNSEIKTIVRQPLPTNQQPTNRIQYKETAVKAPGNKQKYIECKDGVWRWVGNNFDKAMADTKHDEVKEVREAIEENLEEIKEWEYQKKFRVENGKWDEASESEVESS